MTCENQSRADERIPVLLDLPFKHKGLQCAPLLGPISVGVYLDTGQNEQAFKSGMTYQGKKMQFKLKDRFGQPISKETLYVPRYAKKCEECSYKILCNGCFNCGACEGWLTSKRSFETCQVRMSDVKSELNRGM